MSDSSLDAKWGEGREAFGEKDERNPPRRERCRAITVGAPTKPQRRARPSATKARHRLTLLPPGDFP